jgi:hypothetical protein
MFDQVERLSIYQGIWTNVTWGGAGRLLMQITGIDRLSGRLKARLVWSGDWSGQGDFAGTILDNGSLNLTGHACGPETWECQLIGVLDGNAAQGQYIAQWKSIGGLQGLFEALNALFDPIAQAAAIMRSQTQVVTFSLARVRKES